MCCKNSEMWKGDRKWRREKVVAIQEHVNKLTLFFQSQTPIEVSWVKGLCPGAKALESDRPEEHPGYYLY